MESSDSSDLTVREQIIVIIICLPLTYGLWLLCVELDGVDKSGWVWWPASLGLMFFGGVTITFTCSLVWGFLVSTGIVDGILKPIVYITIVGCVVYLVSETFDFDGLKNRELLLFVLGGIVGGCVVYEYLKGRFYDR